MAFGKGMPFPPKKAPGRASGRKSGSAPSGERSWGAVEGGKGGDKPK
jgi:hypothetical protein